MLNNREQLLNFLEFLVISESHESHSIKLTRNQLTERLTRFLKRSKIKDDADLVFEAWEKSLREQSRLVRGRYYIHYNIYTEVLTIELLPTVNAMKRVAEIYSTSLKPMTIKRIEDLTFEEFEWLMENVFSRVPWAKDVHITKRTRDGGIDFVGEYMGSKKTSVKTLLGQAKHWKSKVGCDPLRSFVGSLTLESKKKPVVGVYVCTGGFSLDARNVIKESPYKIFTFDLRGLANLMLRHEIGIHKISIRGKTIDERFWDEIKE